MSVRLNLIPMNRIIARRRVAAVRLWAKLGAVCVLLMAGAVVFVQARYGANPADLAAALVEATQKATDTGQRLIHLQTERDAAQRRLDANRAVTNQPDYSILLALLARTLDEQVVLRSCAFEAMAVGADSAVRRASLDAEDANNQPGFTVRATGVAENQRAVSGYVLRLERTGLFERVRLVSTRREPVSFGDGSAIGFEVSCFLATGEAKAKPAQTASVGGGS